MVEWKELGEVAKLVRGKVISKDYIRDFEGEYPVYSSQTTNDGVLGNINSYMFDGDYLTWTTDGAYAGTIFRRKGKFSITNVCGLIDITCSNIQQDFLYFWLSKTAKNYVLEGMGNPKLMSNVASTIPIPIPSLKEQIRIVGILDTFTASIDNLKEQIAQRRKQYEYYRDQLLDLEGKPGVEMKSLGEVGEFIRGAGILKSDFVAEGFPCIHYGQIHTKYGISATKAFSQIDETLYKKCKKAVKGDIVLATTSEDAEGCAKPVAWLGEEEVAVSGDAYIYHHNQNGKFMAYQFMTHNFMLFKIMNATGAKVVRISGDIMAKYEFPLPSLEEQQRIVSILDTFEASIQNLEAQLSQREKQYEYYRNKLLTFE
jgi:type I restriction enzyme S subunit